MLLSRLSLQPRLALVRAHGRPRLLTIIRSKAAATTASPISTIDDWYQQPPKRLTRYVGPIKVEKLEGKGRAVVATELIERGTLLLVSKPLAILRAPDGQRPDAETLVDHILESRLHENVWFTSYLYDGSAKSTQNVPNLSAEDGGTSSLPQSTDAVSRQQPEASTSKPKATSGFGKSRATVPRKLISTTPLPEGIDLQTAQRVARMVKFNCFGDAHDDRAAVSCRGETPTAHIGVWPEMSMLNHSCAPNTINYVLGDCLVVRAVSRIRPGDEVTISYLGRPQLTPVEGRIEALKEDYGFTCSCSRCTGELQHASKLDGKYEELYKEVVEELGPGFMRARKARDVQAVQAIQAHLRKSLPQVYTTFRKAFISPTVRPYMLASLYDVFELQMAVENQLYRWWQAEQSSGKGAAEETEAEEEEGQPTAVAAHSQPKSKAAKKRAKKKAPPVVKTPAEVLRGEMYAAQSVADHALLMTLNAVEVVSAGSDLHVILASRRYKRMVTLYSEESVQAREALGTAKRAHMARYGPISQELLLKMIDLNIKLYD